MPRTKKAASVPGAELEKSLVSAEPIAVRSYKDLESQGFFVEEPKSTKAKNMVQTLLSQERISYLHPIGEAETLGISYAECIINGVHCFVLKGVSVTIPRQIAEHLSETYTAKARSIRDVKVLNPTTGKLTVMGLDEKSQGDQDRLKL